MSAGLRRERMTAVGLVALIALCPVVDVVATGSTGSTASVSQGTRPSTVVSTTVPELGQAATLTPTPSPAPTTAPGAPRTPVGPTGPDPVLVLSGLIAVVLLALGVWFLLR